MSFILDALKKSEADRQEKSSPGIADVPTAVSPSASPSWLRILVGLLAINLVVLMVVLLRPSADPTPASTSAAPEPVTRVVETPPTADIAVEREQPESPPAPREIAMADTAATTAPIVDTPPAVAEEPQPAPAEPETLLTFNDLRASGNVELPDLHIDLHVYADTPAERFVFINMNQYRENATLSEGPKVRSITPEGVILEYVGTTFLLPRE